LNDFLSVLINFFVLVFFVFFVCTWPKKSGEASLEPLAIVQQ
jgi:hypothetical protein